MILGCISVSRKQAVHKILPPVPSLKPTMELESSIPWELILQCVLQREYPEKFVLQKHHHRPESNNHVPVTNQPPICLKFTRPSHLKLWFTTSLTTFGPLWPLMIKYNWPDHANTSTTKNNKTPNKRKAPVSSCRKHPPNLPNVVSPTKPPTIILRIASPR